MTWKALKLNKFGIEAQTDLQRYVAKINLNNTQKAYLNLNIPDNEKLKRIKEIEIKKKQIMRPVFTRNEGNCIICGETEKDLIVNGICLCCHQGTQTEEYLSGKVDRIIKQRKARIKILEEHHAPTD